MSDPASVAAEKRKTIRDLKKKGLWVEPPKDRFKKAKEKKVFKKPVVKKVVKKKKGVK